MNLEVMQEVLTPYFDRIGRRAGLPRWMNRALKTRPDLPMLLREVMDYYLVTESLFEFKGEVRLKRERLYHHLAEFRPDWVLRQPHRLAGLVVARAGGASWERSLS